MSFDNSNLFIEILRPLVCVIVYCYVCRHSFISVNVLEYKEVDGTCSSCDRLLVKGLEEIKRERLKFVARSLLINGYYVIRTEPVWVCDHRSSKSETRSVTVVISELLCFMSFFTVLFHCYNLSKIKICKIWLTVLL